MLCNCVDVGQEVVYTCDLPSPCHVQFSTTIIICCLKNSIKRNIKTVIDETKKIVYFIKSRLMKSRLFKLLCEGMGSFYSVLLFQTKIRWLGRVLTRLRGLHANSETYTTSERNSYYVFSCSASTRFNRDRQNQWISRQNYYY